jgi:hypothetical protein
MHLAGPGIELFGAIEGDGADAIGDVVEDGLVSYGGAIAGILLCIFVDRMMGKRQRGYKCNPNATNGTR